MIGIRMSVKSVTNPYLDSELIKERDFKLKYKFEILP